MVREREGRFRIPGMMKESSFEKKIWFIVILVETALLVIAGIFYKGREAVELTYMQEELVDDS